MPGSLIVKVIDKKPYIVGVQANENEGHLVTKEILKMVREVTKKDFEQRQINGICSNDWHSGTWVYGKALIA